MGKYKNIAEQLKKKNTSYKKSSDNDIFSCYYCPTSGHSLCPHQDKCILDAKVQDILISIKKITTRIYRLKQQEKTEKERNRLIIERKRLFREYYKIKTNTGGFA